MLQKCQIIVLSSRYTNCKLTFVYTIHQLHCKQIQDMSSFRFCSNKLTNYPGFGYLMYDDSLHVSLFNFNLSIKKKTNKGKCREVPKKSYKES